MLNKNINLALIYSAEKPKESTWNNYAFSRTIFCRRDIRVFRK